MTAVLNFRQSRDPIVVRPSGVRDTVVSPSTAVASNMGVNMRLADRVAAPQPSVWSLVWDGLILNRRRR